VTHRQSLAYVLGHYPSTSQTFLRDEITGVETTGIDVVRVAINPPMAPLKSELDLAEQQRTFCIKTASRSTQARAVLRAFARDPVAFARTLLVALRSGGTDIRQIVWGAFYFAEALVLWDHCDRAGVRRLHAHFTVPASTVAWLAALYGGPEWRWSMTIHGPHDFFEESLMLLPYKADSVATIICISDYGRAQVLRNLTAAGWPKVVTRRCGIDLERFRPREARPIGEPARILIVGRLAAEKGHLVLLEALRSLIDRGVPASVDIVGRGPAEQTLRDLARRLGLEDDVEFHGELPPEAVARHVSDADVFCLPSFNEGIPVSIMEAMAVGVPVVTTAVGGVTELVENGRTGLVVSPGRADELAGALEQVITDGDLAQSFVVRGRARVTQLHDLSRNSVLLAQTLSEAA
jgi:colanic acid/amylovoran biosynthesis glycosyltransferase